MTFRDKKYYYKLNGLKGGRPQQDSNIHIELPEFSMVILTPAQYNSLYEKYGYKVLRRALEILDSWLLSSGKAKYSGRNNYAMFRSDGWLINEAKRTVKRFQI